MAIALGGRAAGRRQEDVPEMVLGGYAALAESAWMGAAQASECWSRCALRRLGGCGGRCCRGCRGCDWPGC